MSTLADLYVMFDNIDITVIDFIYKESEHDLQATSDALQSQLQSPKSHKQLKQVENNEFQHTEFKTHHIDTLNYNEFNIDYHTTPEVTQNWKCLNCTFENKHWRTYCEMCDINALNYIKIRENGQKTEDMMDDILTKYKDALSCGSNDVDLELKINYDIGPWHCPHSSCKGRYCVKLFKIDELDVEMERDQYKKQVIVIKTQKRKRVLFKVKTSETTKTTVIENKRVDTAQLGIKNIPIAIACTKCEYILKLNHCQELIQLLMDRVLQQTI